MSQQLASGPQETHYLVEKLVGMVSALETEVAEQRAEQRRMISEVTRSLYQKSCFFNTKRALAAAVSNYVTNGDTATCPIVSWDVSRVTDMG